MKTTVLVLIIDACAGLALAQPHVVLQGPEPPMVCDAWVPLEGLLEMNLAIANPEAVQQQLTLVVCVHCPDSECFVASPTVGFLNGIDTLFEGEPVVDFIEEDTIATWAISLSTSQPGAGLPVSADTIPYFALSFEPDAKCSGPFGTGEVVCFDSSSTPQYQWHADPGPAPSWSGNMCAPIGRPIPNCCSSRIINCPFWLVTNTYFCEVIRFDAEAWWGQEVGPPLFVLVSGPGELDSISGEWTFAPTADDAGASYTVEIMPLENWCGDGSYYIECPCDMCEFQVQVAPNNPPTFAPDQQHIFVATTGDTLPISFEIDDIDECDDYSFFMYYDTLNDLEPPGYLDSLAGIFYFCAGEADTGLFSFSLVVKEAPYADTAEVQVYHFTTVACGDLNHDGDINIVDLTWMVGYLFGEGLPPVPWEAGDVNCDGQVNIVDLTYTVAYLFDGGAEPCAGCP